MEYLDIDAAEAFYLLSVFSFETGEIGSADFDERMACLVDLVDPEDEAFDHLRRIAPDDLLDQTDDLEQADSDVHLERGSIHQDMHGSTGRSGVLPDPPILQLIVHSVAGMKKWIFHEFDEDPYPSVPHGHEWGQKHPKCDPYNGRVYDKHRNEVVRERLSRKTRIALWKDQSFREFALKAIAWYQSEHPYFSFRVAHPLRVPRFRR